jgi:ABC-type glycerol-3-phosphate transport system substrate-binding protein
MMKNRAAQIIAILLLLAGAVTLFRHGRGGTRDHRQVDYWFVAGVKDDIPPCVKLFNETQDSIRVVCTPIPWNEHEKKVLTAILSSDPPDVVNLVTPVPKWAARKALVALDSIIVRDRLDTSQFFPSLWQEMRYRGRIYALPAYTGSYALFYNRRLLREAGLNPDQPPRDWQTLQSYARRLVKRENGRIVRMGFVPMYGTIETPLIIAFELGARFIDASGSRVCLTDSATVTAFQWERDFFNLYTVEEVTAFMGGFGYGNQQGFIAEKVALFINDNSFIDQIEKYNPDLDFGVTMIPAFGDSPSISSAGSWWLAIPRGAREKRDAWTFMKFVVSRETQLAESMSREETLFPVNRLAARDSAFLAVNRYVHIFTDQMEQTRSKSIVPLVHDIFWREFSLARERSLRGVMPPREALLQAERTIQSSLDRALEYDRYVNARMQTEEFFK